MVIAIHIFLRALLSAGLHRCILRGEEALHSHRTGGQGDGEAGRPEIARSAVPSVSPFERFSPKEPQSTTPRLNPGACIYPARGDAIGRLTAARCSSALLPML